jgi:hypothetical protein
MNTAKKHPVAVGTAGQVTWTYSPGKKPWRLAEAKPRWPGGVAMFSDARREWLSYLERKALVSQICDIAGVPQRDDSDATDCCARSCELWASLADTGRASLV